MKTERRVSYIENFFSKLLTASGASDNIFVGTLPLTTDGDWDDMIYVELQKMSDRTAFLQGSALIYLYARPTGTPTRKNVTLLNKMEKKVYQAIEDARDDVYAVHTEWSDNGYDDDRNFHFNVISVSVTVR